MFLFLISILYDVWSFSVLEVYVSYFLVLLGETVLFPV